MAADDRNQYQIIRKDARGCFVEAKSDSFPIGKAHMEFASYDVSKPAGQRFTNHVHIYINAAEFANLAHFILHGGCHPRAAAVKQEGNDALNKPLYQSLGGTSAERLAMYSRPREPVAQREAVRGQESGLPALRRERAGRDGRQRADRTPVRRQPGAKGFRKPQRRKPERAGADNHRALPRLALRVVRDEL